MTIFSTPHYPNVEPLFYRVSVRFLVTFGAVLALAIILLGITQLVRNWGVWKIHYPSPRPHYTRTWHGWVERDKKLAKDAEKRQKRKNPTITTVHGLTLNTWRVKYNWLYSDLWHDKQQRYNEMLNSSVPHQILLWIRNLRHRSRRFNNSKSRPDRASDIEEGRVSSESPSEWGGTESESYSFNQHDVWPRHDVNLNSPISSTHMVGALPRASERYSSTASKRKRPKALRQVWKKRRQGGIRSNKTFPRTKLFDSSGHVARRVLSLPSALQNAYRSRCRSPSSNPLLDSPSRSYKRPKFRRSSIYKGSRIIQSSESVASSGHSVPYLYGRKSERETCMPPTGERMKRLAQRREKRKDPVVLDPYTSVGGEFSGTVGRPGTPTEGWPVDGGSIKLCIPGMNEDEVKVPSRGTASFESSSRSSKDCLWLRTSQHHDSEDLQTLSNKELEIGITHVRSSEFPFPRTEFSKSGETIQQDSSPREIKPNVSSKSTISKPEPSSGQPSSDKKILKRAESEPFLKESVSTSRRLSPYYSDSYNPKHPKARYRTQSLEGLPYHVSKTNRSLAMPTPDSAIPESSTHSQDALRIGDDLVVPPKVFLDRVDRRLNRLIPKPRPPIPSQTDSEAEPHHSAPEQSFLNDLDRRLDRLEFELSPGFHMLAYPFRHGVRPGGAAIASRVSWTPMRNSSFKNPLNARPKIPRTSTGRSIPLANGTRSRRPRYLGAVSAAEIGYWLQEPEEHKMDVAAWLFRRPPGGERRANVAEKPLLYTGGRSHARTQAQWQIEDVPLVRQSLQGAMDGPKEMVGRVVGWVRGLGERVRVWRGRRRGRGRDRGLGEKGRGLGEGVGE